MKAMTHIEPIILVVDNYSIEYVSNYYSYNLGQKILFEERKLK